MKPAQLALTLALLAAAAPVSQTELFPTTFDHTVSDGLWLIEYFSPYCHHCREFAPTWERLHAETDRSDHPGIHLAQVNCAGYGDFCTEKGVKRYPQINLYNSGSLVEQYHGQLDYDTLRTYIQNRAEPTSEPTHPPPPLRLQTPNANPAGTVVALDPTNFSRIITQGPTFVKFFVPWCGYCKQLAPTWTDLARHMQYKLEIAQVNCDDHSALCSSQHVKGYPTLIYYADGEGSEYMGGRSLDDLITFLNDVSVPPVQELVESDFALQISQNSVMYLLLHSKSDNTIINQAIQASRVLLSSPIIFTSSSPDLFSRYNIPASSHWVILAFKDHDSSFPVAKFYAPSTLDSSSNEHSQESLTNWLLANRLPTSIELTQDSFQLVMKAPHEPLVVVAAATAEMKDNVAEKLTDIGKMWQVRQSQREKDHRSREVVFTWMDAGKWAKWLKSMYGINPSSSSEPVIVVADHARLSYYDVDQNGHSIKPNFVSLSSTIDGILSGKIKPKSSENVVERMARYLNSKMLATDVYVRHHPWKTLFFVATVLLFAFFAITYVSSQDPRRDSHDHRHSNSKPSSRLD